MRLEDYYIAHHLHALNNTIRELKLQRCCHDNRQALEEAMDESNSDEVLTNSLTDFIRGSLSPALKDIGLTRMNITSRRFSVH